MAHLECWMEAKDGGKLTMSLEGDLRNDSIRRPTLGRRRDPSTTNMGRDLGGCSCRQWSLLYCLVTALICLTGCSGADSTQSQSLAQQVTPSRDDQTTYRDRIRQRLSDSDPGRLSSEISAMAMDMRNPAVCETLRALWDGSRPAGVNAPADVFSVPMVRLSLASTLQQCKGQDDRKYYDYVISILDLSHDDFDRMRAAISLGVVGTDQDIERLRLLATKKSSANIGVGAVGGLSLLHSSAADNALKSIAADQGIALDVRESARKALEQ